MKRQSAKATISITDYAALVEFAKMRGTQISEMLIENLVVVDRHPHRAMVEFRRLAQGFTAVLNIEEFESHVPIQRGDALMFSSYHHIRGTAVRLRPRFTGRRN